MRNVKRGPTSVATMPSGPSSSGQTPPFQTNSAPPAPTLLDPSLAALHDFLTNHASLSGNNHMETLAMHSHDSPGAAGVVRRGGDLPAPVAAPAVANSNFADLLAEFTLPPNSFSPDAHNASLHGLGAGAGGVGAETSGAGMAGMEGSGASHGALLENLRLLYPTMDSPAVGMQSPSRLQGEVQAHLQHLLASGLITSETPTPTLASASNQPPSFVPPQHFQNSSSNGGPGASHYSPHSPSAFSQPSSSQHASPMPTFAHSGSALQHQHQPQQSQVYSQAPQQPPSGSSTPSQATFAGQAVPGGFMAPPTFQQMLGHFQPDAATSASQNFFAQQLQNAPFPAQVAALQLLMGAQMQAQQQQPQSHQQLQQQQQDGMQQQLQPGTNLSSGTGSIDGSYRENEYLFSPLMSPTMTPHSAFTNASSLPPSVGPNAVPLVSPAELFPPLTSPALGPQLYKSDVAPSASSAQLNRHQNPLQGLVDGVGALSTQLQGAPVSPASSTYYSPRLGPADAGTSTGAGAAAGRRGASSASKKARPSPLIKPAPDGALDRRRSRAKTASGAPAERRSGSKSATSSPFIGPTGGSTGHGRAASIVTTASSSNKTSPSDQGDVQAPAPHFGNGGGVSFDTPSPVDLASSGFAYTRQPSLSGVIEDDAATSPSVDPQVFAMAQAAAYEQQQQQQQQAYQHEPMGPPPPPSAGGFNPVTPASFMNFSSDFDVNGLLSLSPTLGAMSAHDLDSALSSLNNSPALHPQPDSAFLTAMDLGSAAQSLGESANAVHENGDGKHEQEKFIAPAIPSAAKAAPKRKSTSVRASPALKPVDAAGAKGKGKATGNGGGSTDGKRAKPAAKIAPSPKIGPSPKIRPLLASSAAPDAQARLAAKSNYENILDGRGPDLLGLPSSMQCELQAGTPAAASGPAPTPDSRRSSHKVAEQKRRDSLKLCFDELRKLLPPILPYTDELDRRPGDGNVGGQRHGELDPNNPNRGVSKVALLRRSNEYLEILRERIERRDKAILALRDQMTVLRKQLGVDELGEDDEEVPGLDLDLDHLDKEEKQAGNLAFYEDLDFDQKVAPVVPRRPSASSGRRPSVVASESKPTAGGPARSTGTRRSARMSQSAQEVQAMEVEEQE